MIHPLKYYSLQDLEDLGKEGFFPFKEKITIKKLIETGQLVAMNASVTPNKIKFYKVLGADILAFLDKRGTFQPPEKGKQWNKDEKSKTTKTKKKSGV